VIRQGRQVITRNSSVRVGGGGVWQLAAAGSPGAGLGPAVWLVVKFKAGGRRPVGCRRWPVAPRCDPAAGMAASRVTVWGYIVRGYLPGQQVSTRNRGVRLVVMRSGSWRKPGAPERGLARWYGWRLGSGPEAGRVQALAGCPAV